jgi:organic hydroperoxide reductase OsmC/OhrA
MSSEHHYKAQLVWEGNRGDGTSTYQGYGRQWRIRIDDKPDLVGSADAVFRGDRDKYNPEDLLVMALSSCHMLSYLALCSRNKVSVLSYIDEASGEMKTGPDGGGRFVSVTLRPRVEVADSATESLARELHEKAHATCFVASSVNFPVHHEAVVTAKS